MTIRGCTSGWPWRRMSLRWILEGRLGDINVMNWLIRLLLININIKYSLQAI